MSGRTEDCGIEGPILRQRGDPLTGRRSSMTGRGAFGLVGLHAHEVDILRAHAEACVLVVETARLPLELSWFCCEHQLRPCARLQHAGPRLSHARERRRLGC